MDECMNNMKHFCVMCAKYTVNKYLMSFSEKIREVYMKCFDIAHDIGNNAWAPKVICRTCDSRLRHWQNGSRKMSFSSPVIWRAPHNHDIDCYFCLNRKFGLNSKSRKSVKYIETSSVTMPVIVDPGSSSNAENSVDTLNEDERIETDGNEEKISESSSDEEEDEEEDYDDLRINQTFHSTTSSKFNQDELNDLVRDVGLSKEQSELLASRLQEKKILEKGTKVTFYRNRDEPFRKYFFQDENMVYSNNISGLFGEFGVVHHPEEWRLFIDSSKRSLKAVLLNNGNKLASIPIAHSTILDKSYVNMEYLLRKINYEKNQWKICMDLKVVTIILGQQSGFTKYPCFLCEWDSRARDDHYKKKIWPPRQNFILGQKNIVNKNLVDPANILLPPLHIKLGLIKQLVKALKKRECRAFQYLFFKFPKLSEAKINEGIFDGPQIRELIKDKEFPRRMSVDEKKAWQSFIDVCEKFLGNNKDPHYKNVVSELIVNFEAVGCLMSLKLHFLDSHLEHFPENLGNYGEEQGERFHQDIKEMEKRYQGFWDINMMSDYCWSLKRDTSVKHKRKALRRSFHERCRPHKKARKD